MKTIIIYRLGSLGDTVVALPCFHRIAQSFPDARRIVLTNYPVSQKAAPLMSIVDGSSLVHGCIQYPTGLRNPLGVMALKASLQSVGATALVYLTAPRGALAVWRDLAFFQLCGIRSIIGAPKTHELRSHRIDPTTGLLENEAERLARCVSALGPIDLNDRNNWDLRLQQDELKTAANALAELKGAPFIAVHAGGKQAAKDWGEDYWMLLLDGLVNFFPNFGLVLIGSRDEADKMDRLGTAWNGPVINLAGTISPRVSAAVLGKARFFVGHDSGPMHLAACMGTPCIAIFGNRNRPGIWYPWGRQHRVLYGQLGIRTIPPQQVIDTAVSMALGNAWH